MEKYERINLEDYIQTGEGGTAFLGRVGEVELGASAIGGALPAGSGRTH